MAAYIQTLGVFQLLGVAGFFVYIAAFGAVQWGLLDGNSATYSLANIVAAGLVALSLTVDFNLASALIQGSWIVIGVTGLCMRSRGMRSRACAARGGARHGSTRKGRA